MLTIFLALFSLNVWSQSIEESYVIYGSDRALKLVSSQPALTIDHVHYDHFEVYGPKGTGEWLKNLDIQFVRQNQPSFKFASQYPSYEQLTDELKTIAAAKPDIVKLISIGKSSEGRELWVLKISDNVEKDELEPEFKYISSMHGDEITGRELLTFFAKDLVNAYGVDQEMTELINQTEIYIMPSMNPDGSHYKMRANARYVDLNRDFPDWMNGDLNNTDKRQPETIALMNFQKQRNFALSANFHAGAVVVNYPWDNTYDQHPFDHLVENLSLRYADYNPAMRNSSRFARGVTNGAQWYVLHGGMQDWSYYFYNDLQVTVELSNRKWPQYSQIPQFYQDNKQSLLEYLKSIHQGVGFKLTSMDSATIELFNQAGENLGEYSFSHGEFYKVLEPGQYEAQVKQGSTVKSYTFEVDSQIDSKYLVVQ